MKLNKWIIGMVGIGVLVVGALGVSVLAGPDRDRDTGRETALDADEILPGVLDAGDANAQQVAPTPAEANESDEGLEAGESNEAGEGDEALESSGSNETGEGNEAVEANEGLESGEANEATLVATPTGITADQAKAIALAAYPGTTAVGAVEFETYQGIAVYSIDLSTGLDVFVDANTGKVVGAKQE